MRHTWVSRVGMVALVGGFCLLGSGLGGTLAVAAPPVKGSTTDLSGITQNWDKVLPADTRFLILPDFNNEAVRDNETGLVWERSPDLSFRTWSEALRHCANRVVGGRFGFRLPSMPELASLLTNVVEPTIPSRLPLGHPFTNIQPSAYRTATTDANVPTNAWAVSIGGGVVGTGSKADPDPVWCVRGPMNADTY
jgi:hypothetical protein